MTARPPVHEELRTLTGEVQRLASSVVDVHGRLAAISERSEQEITLLLRRLSESERRRTELLSSRRLDSSQGRQQLETLERQREADRRKLRHARKFIKDLLDDKTPNESSSSSSSPSRRENAVNAAPSRASPSSSSSSSTSSMHASTQPDERHQPSPQPSVSQESEATVRPQRPSPNEDASNGVATTSSEEARESGTQALSTSLDTPSGEDGISLRIRHGVAPASAKFSSPRLSVSDIKEALHLSNEQTALLDEMGTHPSPHLQFRIVGPHIFLYDPTFLEEQTQERTFLIDWGEEAESRRVLDAIESAQAANTVLHTFIFPMHGINAGWRYVGAHTYHVFPEAWNVWRCMRRREGTRSRIVDRLCTRRGLPEDGHELDEYTPECAQMLEDGHLRQVCVEMTFETEPYSETKRMRKILSHRNAQTSPTVPTGGRATAEPSNRT
ncbi:uncharacterized protein SCHCODRAFT_02623064 [Schizophyllum commune H4-8]|nr:uncharacterized protein SCHCODRAFT_02623064 [Schizophyllum commune H4-8]KAI5893888.1 hypothetical protein SCHCODRAFT_02623064 [Schizophyllum commune H4-8]